VHVPLSIPVYYDDEGTVQPSFEPVFYDNQGRVRPITPEFMEEYLYGANLFETKYNKMVKLYGSGTLN